MDEIAILESIELTFCLIAEEVEVRVVHVAAGWAGWIHTGDTIVKAEWEAYVGNASTGTTAWSNYVGDEKMKNWDHGDDDDYDDDKGGGIREIHHPHFPFFSINSKAKHARLKVFYTALCINRSNFLILV